jgi:putative transposase
MTRQSDCTLSPDLVQLIADQGLDALPKMIRIVINHAMQAERSHYLNAEVHERTAERRGYANGSKPKTVTTRMGQATFAVPQVRDSSFYPQVLEKGLRSERALTLALAEMYVQASRRARWPRSPRRCAVSN